jgi:hypothetical protein
VRLPCRCPQHSKQPTHFKISTCLVNNVDSVRANKLEITPPSNSNHSRDGTLLEVQVAEKLTQFLKDLEQSGENGVPLNMAQVARSAGLGALHDTYYRGISNDAPHPSLTALKRYLEVDENKEITGLRRGPNVTDVEQTLIASCTACLQLVARMVEGVEHPEIEEKLGRCFEEYKRPIEGANAAALK